MHECDLVSFFVLLDGRWTRRNPKEIVSFHAARICLSSGHPEYCRYQQHKFPNPDIFAVDSNSIPARTAHDEEERVLSLGGLSRVKTFSRFHSPQ